MDIGLGLRRALGKLTNSPFIDEKIIKETVKEIQRTLISGDVNVRLVFDLSKRIERKALEKKELQGVSAKEHIVKVVYDELVNIMGEKYEPKIQKTKILLLGLYGSGKTTSAAKLGYFYKSRGLTVALVSCDTDRPAAFEQLEQNAKKAGVKFYGIKGEKDPVKILNTLLPNIKEDVIIVDSAGRSALDEQLTKQLKAIESTLNPDEKFLVISADIGQIAKKQAEAFNESVGITGVIITKMDGSGKGGGALSAIAASNSRACFIGVGEKHNDFEIFDPKKFVGKLLGFPDLESLIEKIKTASQQVKLDKKSLNLDKITLTTFYEQMKMMKSMGPLSSISSMLGMPDIPKDVLKKSEAKLKKYGAIISSMTPYEREESSKVKKSKSRLERISKGSGTSISDIRELIENFEKLTNTFSKMKKNRLLRKRMGKMIKGQGNMPPGFSNDLLSKLKNMKFR